MTQNDISYYQAKKAAEDARLRRRETKRHDKAMESLQRESNVASMIGAQAHVASAEAAAQTAKTNQSKYELEWEKEYGWKYGTDPQAIFGDGSSDVKGWKYLDDDPSSGIIIPIYSVEGYSYRGYEQVPQTYVNKVREGQQTKAQTEKITAEKVKTVFDIAKTGGQTVEIVQNIIEGD